MPRTKLQRDCLPISKGTRRILVRAMNSSLPIAHALSCTWSHDIDNQTHQIFWITQLVGHTEHREQGIATRLLSTIAEAVAERSPTQSTFFGILSSHPATIRAFLRAFSNGIEHSTAALVTTQKHAPTVLAPSPVEFVRTAQSRGTLFDRNCADGTVSSAFTGFWVDHAEPRAALERVSKDEDPHRTPWAFGGLAPGCEFLCIVEAPRDVI